MSANKPLSSMPISTRLANKVVVADDDRRFDRSELAANQYQPLMRLLGIESPSVAAVYQSFRLSPNLPPTLVFETLDSHARSCKIDKPYSHAAAGKESAWKTEEQ